MKPYHVFIILLPLLVAGCTEFLVEQDDDDIWEIRQEGHVKLYYKQPGASDAPSPTKAQAAQILDNQQLYYQAIQDSIKRKFNDSVLVYLYNKDQAAEILGTANGGLSQPRFLTVYYSFIHDIAPYTDAYGIKNPYLGAHEMVHIITHHLLGHPGTKMMSEGYAVWLDGSYGRRDIEDIISHYSKQEPNKLLSPTQLLNESTETEAVYYPNAGLFTRYLVHRFGVETINKLFNTSQTAWPEQFEHLTGTAWQELEKAYQEHVKERTEDGKN
mgnify:CR=1 FL=1